MSDCCSRHPADAVQRAPSGNVRQRHAAGSGRQRAVQHLQQGTFAAAVMADQTDAVAFFRVKERSVKSGPNAVSTCRDCALNNVLIVNLLKSYRQKRLVKHR
jgi:hypothetical protein